MSLPAEPTSAAVARRFVRDVLHAWGADALEDSAVLLTSELVTNALLHARSAPDLDVRLVDGRLRVGVSDTMAASPVRKHYGKEAATGRGLLLIETLADAWGTESTPQGKVVWFELTAVDDGRASRSAVVSLGSTTETAANKPDGRTTAPPADRRRTPGEPRSSTRQSRSRLRQSTARP